MEEKGKSRKVRKSESPKVVKKSVRKDSFGEEESNSAPDSYRDDIPNSEIKNNSALNKSDPDSYRDEHPTSEITMEVHHHPQLEHKSKPWKEYLLEGFMIFVAVTMGFFAESLREHINDHSKEREYIVALKAELRGDTVAYNKSMEGIFMLRPLIDSLFENAANPARYGYKLKGKWNSVINDKSILYAPALAIIQQLKSSGNLRLVDKKDIAIKIVQYETFVEGEYKRIYANTNESISKLYAFEDELCDYTDFNRSINKALVSKDGSNQMGVTFFYDMPLKVRDPVKLNQLANSAVNYNGWNVGYIRVLKKAKAQAADLLQAIEKGYNLGNE